MKTFEELLSYHTGYTVDELTERSTEPLLQPYDVLLAKKQFEQQKNCTIPVVVGRSELLPSSHDIWTVAREDDHETFCKWLDGKRQ